jgi:hypothetical protein
MSRETVHVINGDKVFVTYDTDRKFWGCEPYVAMWDGYDGAPIDYETPSQDPIGIGHTEQEAIDDLLEK